MATEPTPSAAANPQATEPRRSWAVGCAAALLAMMVLAGGGLLGARYFWAVDQFHQAEQGLERRDFREAREHLVSCLKVWPHDGQTHLLLARAARRSGDLVEAQRELDLARDYGAEPSEVSFEQELLGAQHGTLPPVERSLIERLERDDANAPLILEALVQGYVANHRAAEALYRTRQLLERVPDHLEARRWQGWALEKLNRPDEAREVYTEALRRDPDCEWAHLSLGELLLQKQYPKEALEHFELLLQRSPNNAALLLGAARCRRELRQLDEAQRLIDRVLAAGSTEFLVLRERGAIALDAGRLVEAEDWLRRALAAQPKDFETNQKLGICLGRLHKDSASRDFLARSEAIDAQRKRLHELNGEIARQPYNATLRSEAGNVARDLGEEEQALYWYQQALVIDPRYGPAHLALAELYEHRGQAAQAAVHRRAAGR